MSRSVSWKEKLFLALFGTALGLIAVEIGLRILEMRRAGSEFSSLADLRQAMLEPDQDKADASVNLRSIVNPHPADDIIYDLRPGLKVRFQQAMVTTNSCGMRDRERSYAKDADTYRIAMLGDSFTFGWGVEQDESFAAVLEQNLNRISRGKPKFEVLNFGVPGYSTFQEVAQFAETGASFDPDAIIVFFISNDYGLPFFVKDIASPGGTIFSSVRFARLSWRKTDPKIEQQRLQMLGWDPNTALRRLSDLTRKRGITLTVVVNPRKGWKATQQGLWVLRERPDIRVLELRKSFMHSFRSRGIPEKDLTLPHDPHPSALRHKLLGDLMTPYFMDVIE